MDKNNIEELLLSLKLESNDSYTELRKNISKFEIPADISMIQDQFDVTSAELMCLQTDFEKHLKYIETTELVQNLLNYKIYEVEYNFMKKMKKIQHKRKAYQSDGTDSKTTYMLIELEKEMNECENNHEASHSFLKEQKLEAQEAYERTVTFLDDLLEVFKKHYQNLILLLEAETSTDEIQEGHLLMTEEIEKEVERYMQLQASGWTPKQIQDLSEAHKTFKMTYEGLLVSKDGEPIPYKEVEAKQLLNRQELYEQINEETVRNNYKRKLKDGSIYSEAEIPSEDVNYLKEHLGTPLTLALAEITSVQPRDPIHYLGHWLFKYRYNQEIGEVKKQELQHLLEERQTVAAKRWKEFIENEARSAVIDMIVKAEEEALQNEMTMAMGSEEEYEDLEYETRDRFGTYQ